MDLLADVLNLINEYGGFVSLTLNMGRILSMWLQEVVQHQWDPRFGILAPPERGYGWWSYGEPCCSCVEHREEYHPLYVDA
jgi:hypothetical protein